MSELIDNTRYVRAAGPPRRLAVRLGSLDRYVDAMARFAGDES